MPIIDISIPQLGEGLHEVLIREFLKQPGQTVKRDEPIYVMETDKALVDAESPVDGVLQEWLAGVNAVVPVGDPVGRILTHGKTAAPVASPKSSSSNPADATLAGGNWVERPLRPQQTALLFRLKRSSQVVVPGNIARAIEWQRITDIVGEVAQFNLRASEFQILAYCVAQATKSHPKFRSTLTNSTTVREYSHLNLGLAMARPDDELITAVIQDADELGLADFVNYLKRKIRQAWKEGDQAGDTTQLVVSYLGSYGVTEGVPTLVAPASAVVFIGASYKFQDTLQAKVSITFDHRLINGVGAAQFINTIDREIDQLHGQTTQLTKENASCLLKK